MNVNGQFVATHPDPKTDATVPYIAPSMPIPVMSIKPSIPASELTYGHAKKQN